MPRTSRGMTERKGNKTMRHDTEIPVKRRPVNLTIREDVIASAKELGLNVSKLSEVAIIEAVRKAKEQAWLEDNKSAIFAHNERIEREGLTIQPYWLDK